MRHVLVTGPESPLVRRTADRLRGSARFVDVHDPSIRSGSQDESLTQLLRANDVDTVVHCALAPDRCGATAAPTAADVIGTMTLCAALSDHTLPVRSLVLASSSAVYPVKSYKPLLYREDSEADPDQNEASASILEAEAYARDLAVSAPHLNVGILRLGEIAGAGVHGPLSSVLSKGMIPAPIGFDPQVQLLHIDDAVAALAFAAELELAGTYNVGSTGVIRWSDAARILRKRVVPVLPVEAGPLQPLLEGLGVPHVPNGLLSLLRFGLALDVSKLEAAGFTPSFDQAACLETFAAA